MIDFLTYGLPFIVIVMVGSGVMQCYCFCKGCQRRGTVYPNNIPRISLNKNNVLEIQMSPNAGTNQIPTVIGIPIKDEKTI